MEITIGKLLSLVVALIYVVVMVIGSVGASVRDFAAALVALLLPLALIWFPDEIGGFTGPIGRGGNVDTETAPVLISFMGWLFLLGLPVIAYLLSRH